MKMSNLLKLYAFVFIAFILNSCTSTDQNVQQVDFEADATRVYETNGVHFANQLISPIESRWYH
jgi:hypothetical protein